ncbi:polyketide synthase [Algibacter mikhailovii]|uniref:Amino acid adenylation domain-containing protein n=1 Tax=Algibacter mikhailovii TaxID=425498 RepID=A0A918QUX1_9FLAO|nr:polyketide synthase [Algibacter mikhailovii]GGZ71910.1 hypothetical protein GCM10007028_06590 [Algibacter mikhailovii]
MNYLKSAERQLLLNTFNKDIAECNEDRSVIDLFLDQVKKSPDNLAVVYESCEITYGELDSCTNQFADYLIDTFNIKQGDCIGLMIDRSEWLAIAILSILKTGAAYVPISTDYPQKRKDYIKQDSHCKIIIDKAVIDNFKTKKDSYAQHIPLDVKLKANDLMYVLYTSGTTGTPKGVMIEHKSVINLINYQTQLFQINESERILQFSNYFFDASVEQFFLSLLNGAALYIIGKEALTNHVLPSFIAKNKITHLHATPSYLETLPDLSELSSLKRIIAGGEVCSVKLAAKLGNTCNFYNKYGPTEATVTTTLHKYSEADKDRDTLSIGTPIGNARVHILSENLELVSIGETGELCIEGHGLARGYMNLSELSAEKFVTSPFDSKKKIYRTGDYAKWLANGDIEFVGRKDDQVKIRGYRMELGEIESALNALPSIKRAVVVASDFNVEEKRLVAYIQYIEDYDVQLSLREQLLEVLPEYMVPLLYIIVDEFAKTPNGKIDRKNLPDPIVLRPDSSPILRKPRNKTEKEIAKIWVEYLGITEVGIDDNFFEMGGTSLLTQKVSARLKAQLNLEIPVIKLYEFPTIADISKFLKLKEPIADVLKTTKKKEKRAVNDIAVIGMSGRFPGADSIQELWDILKASKETISFFSKEELDKSIPEVLRNDPLYVAARGIVPSAKGFDAKFFGINPKLAEAMDPQQRLFLEVAWEVLEQSGYLPKHYKGNVGVYAGCGANSYYTNNVIPNKNIINQLGSFLVNIANDKGYVATRAAYHLNLKGPAVSVHSACSTSLLAIGQAVEAIRSGQCDVAIAGGASVTSPMYSGHLYQEGSMLSANGSCRSFDKDGNGTVFSDGAGAVLLKSLEEAKRDGDVIHGVIKGYGINNDGGNKGSFTAPCVEGQAGAIFKAFQDADIEPSEISYIEAHGTATPVGDPIEMEGLHKAFGKQDKHNYCAIGSIKSNMGHLTAAAGVAGFIKTILALKHKKIPASLGYEQANPAINFENSPFYVNNTFRDWNWEGKRRAGISSFGVGGTNVHIVVEEFDRKQPDSFDNRPIQLLTWSAKTDKSLDGYKAALGKFTASSDDLNIADVAYSLSATRDVFNKRSFTLATDSKNAAKELSSDEAASIKSSDLKVLPDNLAFLFPGQGAQYLQMGKALYDYEDVFRDAVDECAEILLDAYQYDIRNIIYPNEENPAAEKRLKDTQFTQPALFVIEYALAQLWMSWGIQPTLLCGHSIGEFMAAHLAGIFALKDALLLVAVRGKLVSQLPGGSMLSVRTTYQILTELLPEKLSIAAVNSDQLCVASGEDEDIEAFAKVLEQKEIPHRILLTSHAFHSTMMDPVIDAFEAEVKKLKLQAPRIPIVSSVTGKWLSEAEAIDPKYWSNHLRATVRFSEAMDTALALEDIVLLEVGPGRALTTLSQQKKKSKSASSISSLVIPGDNENAFHTVLTALGNLWLKGIEPDWNAFYYKESKRKIILPAYVFDRKPCWLDQPLDDQTLNGTSIQHLNKSQASNKNQALTPMNNVSNPNRKTIILEKISEIIINTSGMELESSDYKNSFLELGLDSLVLTQMAITCKNEFKIPITFRQLNIEFNTPELLAHYLDKTLAPEHFAPIIPVINPTPEIAKHNGHHGVPINSQEFNTTSHNNNLTLDLIAQQIQLLSKELELIRAANVDSSLIKKPIVNGLKPVVNPTSESEIKNRITQVEKSPTEKLNTPPVLGARLGMDESGNPAWFIPCKENDGEYIKIELPEIKPIL